MAKKAAATRPPTPARRPQAAAKGSAATLVRAPGTHDEPAAPKPVVTPTASVRVAARPAVPAAPARATRPAPKPAAPAPRAHDARAHDAQAQTSRIARARATQRARTANLITPEHYSYVRGDLRLTMALAVLMFVVIVALHFILG